MTVEYDDGDQSQMMINLNSDTNNDQQDANNVEQDANNVQQDDDQGGIIDRIAEVVDEIRDFISNFSSLNLPFNVGQNEFSIFGFSFFDSVLKGLDFIEDAIDSYSSPFDINPNGSPAICDWRDSGYVNEIRNQGKFGCCYTFSACAAIEGQYAKLTGKLVKLSGIFYLYNIVIFI